MTPKERVALLAVAYDAYVEAQKTAGREWQALLEGRAKYPWTYTELESRAERLGDAAMVLARPLQKAV